MQNIPMIFQLNGSLPNGRYVPGQYSFSAGMRLSSVIVAGLDAIAFGSLTLKLEVAGVLTGDEVVLTPDQTIPVTVPLDVPVAANAVIRWLCFFTGSTEDAPQQMVLVVSYAADTGPAVAAMSVNWVDQNTSWLMFAYDVVGRTFSDVSDGLSSGRASFSTANGFSFFIQGTEVFRVRGGTVYAPTFDECTSPDPSLPRLELVIAGQVVAIFTTAGMYVPSLTEVTPLPLVADPTRSAYWSQFIFSDGTLMAVAVASPSGFAALSLTEGIS